MKLSNKEKRHEAEELKEMLLEARDIILECHHYCLSSDYLEEKYDEWMSKAKKILD
jgi:hypothetical protein